MKKILILLAAALTAACSSDRLTIISSDPLLKILPSTEPAGIQPMDTVHVARGESAVFQLVISAEDSVSSVSYKVGGFKGMKHTYSGWVLNVKSTHTYPLMDPESLEGETFPDPVISDTPVNISPGEKAVLLVNIEVPEDAETGIHKGKVTINAKGENISKSLYIKVYNVTLPQQTLKISNWLTTDKFSFMNKGREVQHGSPEFWTCMDAVVSLAADFGQNVWIVRETGKSVLNEDGSIGYDFTDFDNIVQFIMDRADVRLLEGDHLAYRSNGGWIDPFLVNVPVFNGAEFIIERLPYTDKRAQEHIRSYIAALEKHLKEMKLDCGGTWFDIYAQHIADEPIVLNIESWEGIAEQVKAASPEMKIIEAYRTERHDPSLIDIIIPQLDEFEWPVYRTCEPEKWFYTCMYPRYTYANRYVNQPLIKTRIMHWINYKYGAEGYLHWGLNYWPDGRDPYGDVSVPENDWPGGDAYVIYPGYRKVYPSIRLFAMRDGINDYELLRLVYEKDPAAAMKFADRVVTDFYTYNTSVSDFRRLRIEMLEYLQEAS